MKKFIIMFFCFISFLPCYGVQIFVQDHREDRTLYEVVYKLDGEIEKTVSDFSVQVKEDNVNFITDLKVVLHREDELVIYETACLVKSHTSNVSYTTQSRIYDSILIILRDDGIEFVDIR